MHLYFLIIANCTIIVMFVLHLVRFHIVKFCIYAAVLLSPRPNTGYRFLCEMRKNKLQNRPSNRSFEATGKLCR